MLSAMLAALLLARQEVESLPQRDVPQIQIAADFWRNHKVAEAGFLAGNLHLAGVAYCAEQLTDGFIPTSVLPILAAPMHGWVWIGEDGRSPVPRDVFESRWYALADRLCDVGLWREVEGGYQVENYFYYQPPRADIEEKQTQRREQARKAARARWDKEDPTE